MADNIQLDSGTGGAVLAADDVSSVFYQVTKLDLGGDGVSVLPSVGAGAVGTGVLRFTLASDDPAVVSLALLDDAIFVDDTATHATGTTKLMGVGAVAVPTDTSITANDIGMLAMSTDRRLLVDAQIVGTDAALDVSGATLTVNAHAVTNAGTFLVQEDGGVLTALEIMDDWDESNRAKVNPIVGQAGVAAGAGAVGVTVPRVTLASDDPAVVALQIMDDWDESDRAKVNIIAGQVGVAGGTGVDGATVLRVSLATDVALPAGTAAIGDVTAIPKTSGGLSFFKSIDLDETEEAVKASAGQLYNVWAFNLTAAPLYLKFYNDTVGNVVVGTTVPDITVPVPANADSDGAGFIAEVELGFAFGTAITVACTTGIADNDSGAPDANACAVTIGFK